jgi:hypothetical protein
MDNPCAGWTGRIFGHKFQRFVVKETPPPPVARDDFWMVMFSETAIEDLLSAKTAREYCVRCVRCGRNAE